MVRKKGTTKHCEKVMKSGVINKVSCSKIRNVVLDSPIRRSLGIMGRIVSPCKITGPVRSVG